MSKTRNALAPVSTLPEEVLAQVFLHGLPENLPAAAEWTEVIHQETRRLPKSPELSTELILGPQSMLKAPKHIRVSSVCETWWALATKCPILWTNLCSQWPVVRQETWIRRSDRRSLSIYAEFTPRPLGDALPRTLHSFPGMQDNTGIFHVAQLLLWRKIVLCVWGDHHSVQSSSAFIKSFCTKVSVLEILTIEYDERGPISLCNIDVAGEETGHRGTSTPLTELVIYNFYVVDIVCVARNLRILKIDTIGAMGQPAVAISNWMVLFQAAQDLEELDTVWTSGSTVQHPRVIEPMLNDTATSQTPLVVQNSFVQSPMC